MRTVDVAVWAGSEIYHKVAIPARLSGDSYAVRRLVEKNVLDQIVDDFGQGATIDRIAHLAFQVNVDRVMVDHG